jgi:glycosyltransferase involved in cell wall biosynthesis
MRRHIENQKKPLVSVVVPNYNHAKYLRKRMDSIFAQTFQDFEVIVLDDASTDDSLSALQPYLQNALVRFFPNERNSGTPFAQWNKGVSLARGRYIWIAESDDIAEPNLLETLVPLLENNSGVGIAYGQSRMVDNTGCEVMSSLANILQPLGKERWNRDFVANGMEECGKYLLWMNTIPNASAVVFRKQLYLKAGQADLSFRLCGDWALWVKMLMLSDLAFHSGILNSFRQHGGTAREKEGWAGFQREKIPIQRWILKKAGLDAEAKRQLIIQKINELILFYRNETNDKTRRCIALFCSLIPFYSLDFPFALRVFLNRHHQDPLKMISIR